MITTGIDGIRMDLDQTFSRIAFYQVLLGILTFCYAEANPGMLLVAGSLVVLSRTISEGPWGRPLPWWAINSLAILAAAWMVARMTLANPNIIVTMGHFTMWLQVLVMFARKSNRDYGQILMLSLLQMIGASVLSVSIIYGLLLGVYCVLALLTVLVFQLKSSRDRTYEANRSSAKDPGRVTRPKPLTGRGYHWHFRLAAGLIAVCCAVVAVSVFILTPRSPEAGLIGDSNAGLGPRQVGFSQQVRLDGPPISQGSQEPVMNVQVTLHGDAVKSRSWLLRGAALDEYDPESRTWKRGQGVTNTDRRIRVPEYGLDMARLDPSTPLYHARVTLRQIGHRNLFTVLPTTYFDSDSIDSVVFSPRDLQMSSGGSMMGAVIYDLYWPLRVRNLDLRYRNLGQPNQSQQPYNPTGPEIRFDPRGYARGWPLQRERFAGYVQGILAEHGLSRDPLADYDRHDGEIARVLADYLRQNYTYELTGPRRVDGREPLIEFVFGHHLGHCELFASALAAMTRSIGMQARVVTGFRAGEFNQIGGYYVVRQSDAHAWTEINLGPGKGWHSFDATPAEEIDRRDQLARSGWLTVISETYEYVEFGWIRSIVAYDVGTRHALLTGVSKQLGAIFSGPDSWLGQALRFFQILPVAWEMDKVNTAKVLGSAVLAVVISSLLMRSLIIRRRRLMKLKLTGLPTDRQRELAGRLGFFIELNDLLARYGYVRGGSQNPRDFALKLIEDRPEQMAPVLALTDLFYGVRFGEQPMDTTRRKRARVYLRQLERALSSRDRITEPKR